MKATLLAAALALPGMAAATVAMDPPQVAQPPQSHAPAHHQLFTLKYVLRLQRADETLPTIVMDDRASKIGRPVADNVSTALLGAAGWHPNVTICHDWGCENAVR
jgi:hypothetical protein